MSVPAASSHSRRDVHTIPEHFEFSFMHQSTAESSFTGLPPSPTSPTSTAMKRQASESTHTSVVPNHKRRRTIDATSRSDAHYSHSQSYNADNSSTMLADDELDEAERPPIVIRLRIPASRRRTRTSGHHHASSASSSSSSSQSSSLTASPTTPVSSLETLMPSLSLGLVTPPMTPPPSFAVPAYNSDEEADNTTTSMMEVDSQVNEKLYIRLRVPPNMRRKAHAPA